MDSNDWCMMSCRMLLLLPVFVGLFAEIVIPTPILARLCRRDSSAMSTLISDMKSSPKKKQKHVQGWEDSSSFERRQITFSSENVSCLIASKANVTL
jgi:hypothetical protein